ncbi:MAG: OmpA family protein [Prevotellaceae bacterium]|jgi:outer membrane protein OmpA-like peptidoglycan-associated protein|nr:OmpA family protein [Prevotellaceae bacterium]
MKKQQITLLLTLLLLAGGGTAWAQPTAAPTRANAKKQMAKKEYQSVLAALEEFQVLYNRQPSLEATLDMAEVLEKLRRYPEAEDYYMRARNGNGGRLPNASQTLAYADVLKMNGKYDDARKAYQSYIDMGGSRGEAQKRIEDCDSAAIIAKRIPMYTTTPERRISTLRDEFPSAFCEGMLVYTTNCDSLYVLGNRDEVLATKAALGQDIDEDTSTLIRMRSDLGRTSLIDFTKHYPPSGKVSHSIYDGNDFEDKTGERDREKRIAKMSTESKKTLKTMEATQKGPEQFYTTHLYLTSIEKKENVGNGFLGSYVWTAPRELPAPFNTGQHSGMACFTSDGNTMYFCHSPLTKSGVMDANGIYIVHKEGGVWGDPVPFPHNNPAYSVQNPCISADGRTLYLASDMPNGVGGFDIYSCTLNNDGTWGKPENLGKVINTPEQEVFPTLDGKGVLYFSSNGHPGLGGLDIFKAVGEIGKWKSVENQRKPLNSPFADFAMVFLPGSDKEGVLASNRPGGYLGDDIYSFVKTSTGEVKPMPKPVVGKPLLVVTVVSVNGTDTSPIENMELKLMDLTKKRGEVRVSDGAGRAYFDLVPNNVYNLDAQSKGYVPASVDNIKAATLPKASAKPAPKGKKGKQPVKPAVVESKVVDNNVYVTLVVRKLSTGTTFKVDNVNYAVAKAELNKSAFKELDKLVSFMKINPSVRIELSSHTDSNGSMETNMSLSQRRSQSCVNYLIKEGIDLDRIVAKGYGPTRPIVKNARTEKEHARNRRTEVKILSTE